MLFGGRRSRKRHASLRCSAGRGETFVWLTRPEVRGVGFTLLPLVACPDWPPDTPRRLGCQLGIANGRSVGNRQRGRPSGGISTTPHGGTTWPRSGPASTQARPITTASRLTRAGTG